MVATSQPLAALAGVRMLLAGGSAADAAVAATAVLAVVEPHSTGPGGDVFALTHVEEAGGRTLSLNASGGAPAALTLDAAAALGHRASTGLPVAGGLPVTVPGAVGGLCALHERHGRLPLADVLAPAVACAQDGFPVSPIIAREWEAAAARLRQVGVGQDAFLVDGRAPVAGQVVRQPALGATLRLVGERGAAGFYSGEVARGVVAAVRAAGGLLDLDDLARFRPVWEQPLGLDHHDRQVLTCPPNGQGIIALEALAILAGDDLAALDRPALVHLQVEALRAAFADGFAAIADPAVVDVDAARLLDPAHAAGRRAAIRRDRATPAAVPVPPPADTTYVSAVDADGSAVSLMSSLYHGFGSGVVAEDAGVTLHNRGTLFSLDPASPNALAPGKRPYHTITPTIVLDREGRLRASLGVMGGFMQPQGQLQLVHALVDLGLDPQAAVEAPRVCVADGRGAVLLEPEDDPGLAEALRARGHRVQVTTPADRHRFGGAQVITRDPASGVCVGGSDPRKDGCAIGL